MENVLRVVSDLVIIAAGLTVAAIDITLHLCEKEHPYAPIKIIHTVIGLYWAGLYIYLLLYPQLQFAEPMRYWIRIGILSSTMATAIGAIVQAIRFGLFKKFRSWLEIIGISRRS